MAVAPLTVHDINRLRAAADENATLADCWGNENVALVTLEWAPQGFRYYWTSHLSCNEIRGLWRLDDDMPVLTVDVVTFPNCPGKGGHAREPISDRYRFWVKPNRPRPRSFMPSGIPPATVWEDRNGEAGQAFQAQANEIHGRLTKLFTELQRNYTTVCACSHRPQQTRRGLQEISFSLPDRTPFVDLIKVLEYQSKFAGVPKQLSDHFLHWLEPDSRSGGFDEVSKAPDWSDQHEFVKDAPKWGADRQRIERVRRAGDVSVSTVLETLGPRAEAHRRDIDRLERENAAIDRMSRRAGKGKQQGGKKGPRKGPRDLTGEFGDY